MLWTILNINPCKNKASQNREGADSPIRHKSCLFWTNGLKGTHIFDTHSAIFFDKKFDLYALKHDLESSFGSSDICERNQARESFLDK